MSRTEEMKKQIEAALNHYKERTRRNGVNPKAVLFDMDGVLYDSMRYHSRAWYETSVRHGLKCTREIFYMFEGRTGDSTVNELYQTTFHRDATAEEKQSIYAEKAALFAKYNDGEAMPGAADVLKAVAADGLQRVLVTGSGQRTLIEKLERTYPGSFIPEKMVTAFDVKFGKPHPEPYLMGLEKAGVEPDEAFVVENAPMGVKAGVAAGIFTIAVNTGPLADEVLLREGADLLLPDMKTLAEYWPYIMSVCR